MPISLLCVTFSYALHLGCFLLGIAVLLAFLLKCYCCLVTSVLSDSVQPYEPQPARLLGPWGFSRQEYWSGLPYPPPRDLPDPGIKPGSSPALQAESLLLSHRGRPSLKI